MSPNLISDQSFKGKLCLTKDDPPKACQFPYKLGVTERTTCTYQGGIHVCPTRVDKAKKPIVGSWRECKDNCEKEVIYQKKSTLTISFGVIIFSM